MRNPWEEIDLKIYEAHMRADNVYQLQTLNDITKQQLNDYTSTNVVILGIAGGNGLDYIDMGRVKKVCGIDVNREYLQACRKRYDHLGSVLDLICCDLRETNTHLPASNMLICNLIIEYLGIYTFTELMANNKERLEIISCTIQKGNNKGFISESGYARAFVPLKSLHQDIEEKNLIKAMQHAGFCFLKRFTYPLPNGKKFVRIDFNTAGT